MFYDTKKQNHAILQVRYFLNNHKTHFIAWLSFIIYESVAAGLYSGQFSNFWNYAVHYALNITLFYVHSIFVLPASFREKGKEYWRLPLFIILEITAYFILIALVDVVVSDFTNLFGASKMLWDQHFYIGTIFRGSYFIGFATGYFFLLEYLKVSRKANQLEKTRLQNIIQIQKIEYSLAKSQISPHFLFNTLDFIYHSTRKVSPIAADAVATLSDMMRFASDSFEHGDFTIIKNEIEQIENLIHLHQLKNNSTLNIKFTYSQEVMEINFIPLVLLTLTENMFKHGDLSSKDYPGSILINKVDNVLIIQTHNLADKNNTLQGLNSGLSNISKRLEYCYAHDASFDIKKSNNYFSVFISVKLPLENR